MSTPVTRPTFASNFTGRDLARGWRAHVASVIALAALSACASQDPSGPSTGEPAGSGGTAGSAGNGHAASGGSGGSAGFGGTATAMGGTAGSADQTGGSGGSDVAGGAAASGGDNAGAAGSGGSSDPGDAGRFDGSGSTGTGGTGGAPSDGGSGYVYDAGPVTPPVPDTKSTIRISGGAGSGYTVEGNIPYGPNPMHRLDVIYPTNAGPKGTQILPVVVMFHGGGWIHNDYDGSGKASMSTFYTRFLKHGFLVCNAEYRVANTSPNNAIAPAAVQDALLAAKWCWDHIDYYHGDRTRYVVTGASAGGHLALMVGMVTPAAMLGPSSPTDYKIAAIVDGYGPADVVHMLSKGGFTAQWIPASVADRQGLAARVSPMTYVHKEVPPLIAVHGSNDTAVPNADSHKLVDALKAAGVDAAVHDVAGAGHGFATPSTAWPDAETAMFDFLTAHGIGK